MIKIVSQFNIIQMRDNMNEDIDSDTNFYKAQCKTSPYYMDSEFNNYVCSKPLCDDQFSILQINARSLNKNRQTKTTYWQFTF